MDEWINMDGYIEKRRKPLDQRVSFILKWTNCERWVQGKLMDSNFNLWFCQTNNLPQQLKDIFLFIFSLHIQHSFTVLFLFYFYFIFGLRGVQFGFLYTHIPWLLYILKYTVLYLYFYVMKVS
jgi:hypothetical protein